MSGHASIEQLSALIDGELSLVAREAVRAHLRDCPVCAARHDELVEVTAALTVIPAELWSTELTALVTRNAAIEPSGRVAPDREKDWSLPIGASLAVIGLASVALVTPIPIASLSDGLRLNVFAALAEGTGVPLNGFLAVLVLLPALGLLAVPLLRHR